MSGLVCVTKPFTRRERRRLVSQTTFGHRPVNDWGHGDLPAPWAEGDLLHLAEVGDNDRLRGMGPGYFVVSAAFSIDEGDAWYFRVTNGHRNSDRMHVIPDPDGCDWMARFTLVDTADPDGLALRTRMLAEGWMADTLPVCRLCGQTLPISVSESYDAAATAEGGV